MLDDGSGVFMSNQIYAHGDAVPGPRTVRVKAALRHEDALGMVDASTGAAFDLALALEP